MFLDIITSFKNIKFEIRISKFETIFKSEGSNIQKEPEKPPLLWWEGIKGRGN